MIELSVDIEDYSSEDLFKVGTVKSAEAPDFDILMISYQIHGEKTRIIDLYSEDHIKVDENNTAVWISAELRQLVAMILDELVIKFAHNAAYERVKLGAWIKKMLFRFFTEYYLPPDQWRCTMVMCAQAGLPLKLEGAGKALGLPVEKDTRGKKCIAFFCKPCKPTKANGYSTRNYPDSDPELYSDFLVYCVRDTDVEVLIYQALKWLKSTITERHMWNLDQLINERGLYIDLELCKAAVKIDIENINNLKKEAIALTGIRNPNSVKQLKDWLNKEMQEGEGVEYVTGGGPHGKDIGYIGACINCGKSYYQHEFLECSKPVFPTIDEIKKLGKDELPDLIKKAPNEKVVQLLEIRSMLNKASIKKYQAAIYATGKDNRAKMLFQFHGARTARWAARRLQPHNFTKNDNKTVNFFMAKIREQVKAGKKELLKIQYGSVSYILSQLIRTIIAAPKDKELITSDFKAIEATVLAYLSGEQWQIAAFKDGVDIYKATYSKMYNVDIEKVSKTERHEGKTCALYLGYQGGRGAFMRAKADRGAPVKDFPGVLRGEYKNPIDPATMDEKVTTWRAANQNVKNYWKRLNEAAITCVKYGTQENVGPIRFEYKNRYLLIWLPSGRCIAYPNAYVDTITIPRAEEDGGPFDVESVIYYEMNKKNQWVRVPTYGGKLTENIVQAYARDLLVYKMLVLNMKGFYIVGHVHDEIIIEIETRLAEAAAKEIHAIMCEPVSWARDLHLKADTSRLPFYKKED